MDIPSLFLVQILPSYLSCDPKVSWWVFIHLPFFQRYGSTYGIYLVPTFLPLLLILLLSPPHPKSLILLLLSSPPSFFSFFFPSSVFLLFLPVYFLLLPSVSAILTFPTLVFTASYILPDISSSLLPLFSSQSQDCDMQAIAFSKSCFTSASQSHQSLFFLYTLGNRCLLLLYFL